MLNELDHLLLQPSLELGTTHHIIKGYLNWSLFYKYKYNLNHFVLNINTQLFKTFHNIKLAKNETDTYLYLTSTLTF